MALTGIQIFKLLPKTNCGECGTPTCLAFAMNLAAGKTELICAPTSPTRPGNSWPKPLPPPIRSVAIGAGETEVKPGGETVMFRHEKTFYNPCGIACLVTPDQSDVDAQIAWFNAMKYERVGLMLRPEMFCVKDTGDAAAFEALVDKIVAECDASITLMSDNVETLKKVAGKIKQYKPLLYAATEANADDLGAYALESGLPLALKAENIEGVQAPYRETDRYGVEGSGYRHRVPGTERGLRGLCGPEKSRPDPAEQNAGLPDHRLPLRG